MASQEEARQSVQQLIGAFRRQQAHHTPRLNERQTAASYIEPLFEALGWAVRNPEEVSLEATIAGDRADYTFRLNGVTQFIVEAKAPHRDLNDPAFKKQAITYAYNKGVNWAILTNFARLAVFHAETERQFLNLSLEGYLDNFDDLWLLSKEALTSGAFQKKAQAYGAMQPSLPVEKSLLDQLLRWRQRLFDQILQYKHRDTSKLTLAERVRADELIQYLLNRLIFIRNAEDRGLEENHLRAALHQWRSSGPKGHLIERLRSIFHDFAQSYDSDLFPKEDDPWDETFVDDELLGQIVEGLYDRPGKMAGYDFKAIGADVLGSIYEQYLGHVAQVVKERSHLNQAQSTLPGLERPTIRLEEMPQRRKAQGIYYTPRWVVDYIVRQTVGRFLKERSHDEILHMKILDPACGSGSFLIRAYDELLAYHARVQDKTPAELDWAERRRILTGNIFGVDLDDQAVQIARLNLLLRALARRETLPSLKENVRRGNSLISGGEAELRPYFGDAWREKHPFSWGEPEGFPEIMKRGGFDVVIGNPPYVRIQTLPREEADYYRASFESAYGSFDIYVLFLEMGIRLLKSGGHLGFICSSKFLKSQYGQKIQQLIAKECAVENIVDLSAQTVFGEATTYPAIVVLRKGPGDVPLRYVSVPQGISDSASISAVEMNGLPAVVTDQAALARGLWPPLVTGDTLWRKLTAHTEPLGVVADKVFVGLQTSADRVYILEKRGEVRDGLLPVYSRALGKQCTLEAEILKPLLSGQDIGRYGTPTPINLLLFPYKVSQGKAQLIPAKVFSKAYPKSWQYLLQNRATLEGRERGKMRHERWYAFGRTQNLALHDLPKLAIPRLVKHLEAVYDRDGSFYLDNVDVGGLILKDGSERNYLYVLGLLHSRLLDFCFRRISAPFRGDFRSANRQFIEPLPIRRIDFSNPEEKAMYDRLVGLVEAMLDLHKRQAPDLSGLPQSEREDIQRHIAGTDREIDDLVYDLYGLTAEERRLVEEEVSRGPR